MFVYLVDMDCSTYISWNYLPVHFKVNKQNSTLQLLSTIQVLEILGEVGVIPLLMTYNRN